VSLPTVEDLAGDPVTRRFDDMFAPPALTNFLGAVQVDHDVAAIRSMNFAPVGQGDTVTGQLFLDGRLFRSYGEPVTFQWRADRVLRSARVGSLVVQTVTACVPGESAVVVDIRLRNEGAADRTVHIGLALDSGAIVTGEPWRTPYPPSAPNSLTFRADRGVVVGTPREQPEFAPSTEVEHGVFGYGTNRHTVLAADGTRGASAQGVDVPGATWAQGVLTVAVPVPAGGTNRAGYVHAVGSTVDGALATYDAVRVPAALEAARELWDAELAGLFDPGGGSFTGCLPVLHTTSPQLRRLYWWGALGVLWFRRDNPVSVLGRSYDTLMPRYWPTLTCMWDYSMSATVHALLDPGTLRRHIEHWVRTDIHTHFGTEWQTGGRVGNWYSVNDFAMTRMVREYVRWSGDRDFLHAALPSGDDAPRTVLDHLQGWASAGGSCGPRTPSPTTAPM
jgi:hypothetical protein